MTETIINPGVKMDTMTKNVSLLKNEIQDLKRGNHELKEVVRICIKVR